MPQPGRRGLLGRVAWHGGLAWRSARWTVLFAFGVGLLVRAVLPVQDAWVAATVAVACALLAVALLVLGEARARAPVSEPVGPFPTDPAAAMERAGAVDQVAHALARAALLLGAFFLGVWLGQLAGLDRA